MSQFIQVIRKNPATAGLAVILCAVLIGGGMYISQLKSAVPSQLEPARHVAVRQGETITVQVRAGQVEDLYGYQFKLAFDGDVLEYQGVESSMEDIGTIFKKDFDGYLLVGATQVGEKPGVSAGDTPVCEITFAVKAGDPALEFVLSEVSVVTSEMDYIEDLQGWGIEIV